MRPRLFEIAKAKRQATLLALLVGVTMVFGYRGWVLSEVACRSTRNAALIAQDVAAERAEAARDPFAERIADLRILPERELHAGGWDRAAKATRTHAGFFLHLPYPACASEAPADETGAHQKILAEIQKLAGSPEAGAMALGWKSDAATYCRSLGALQRLQHIREAAAEACKKPHSKYTQSCGTTTTATRGLEREITQLETVRGINERKLRDKWGARLASLVHCDPSADRADRSR